MGISGRLRYIWNVRCVGQPVLRWQRLMAERKARGRRMRDTDCLAPPLILSARTKELVARHYLEGRYANLHRKVAWVTSGAPIEVLKALDFYVYYPENHGAICGVTRSTEELSAEAEK